MVGGWQKLEAKRSLPALKSTSLALTTFPFLNLQAPVQVASPSALKHFIMILVSVVMSLGAQNVFSGINSAPLLKTHGAGHSVDDLPIH